MSHDILVPTFDSPVGEIAVAAWLKEAGESIRAGEVIAEIVTDKVNVEIASPVTGVLEAILAREGETVVEGQPLARISASSSGLSGRAAQQRRR